MSGYIPISRKLFEHELWSERREFSRAEAWIDLLRSVRFEANSTSVLIGCKSVVIDRGETAASLRYLADRWGWSKNKVDNFLNYLITQGMISKRTADGTQQTVVTITNYEYYNGNPKIQRTLDGTPQGHRRDTTGTNINKVNKDNNTSTSVEGSVEYIDNNLLKNNNAREKTLNWREDFEVYKDGLREAYNALINDSAFIAQQQIYHPGMDILLSLKKACTDYWATETGWEQKKSKRSKDLNWKQTLVNALSNPQNKVYYDRAKGITGGNAQREANNRNSRERMGTLAAAILSQPPEPTAK